MKTQGQEGVQSFHASEPRFFFLSLQTQKEGLLIVQIVGAGQNKCISRDEIGSISAVFQGLVKGGALAFKQLLIGTAAQVAKPQASLAPFAHRLISHFTTQATVLYKSSFKGQRSTGLFLVIRHRDEIVLKFTFSKTIIVKMSEHIILGIVKSVFFHEPVGRRITIQTTPHGKINSF